MAVLSGFSGSRTSAGTRRPRRWRGVERTPTLVGELVAKRARVDGDEVAMLAARGDRSVTWDDVAAAAELWQVRFGDGRQQADVGTRVGLRMSSQVDFGREYLAGLAAGVTVVPLDPATSEAELLWSAASLALTHVMSDAGEVIELYIPRSPHGGSRSHRKPIPTWPASDALAFDRLPAGVGGTGGVGRAWHPSVAPLDTPLPSVADLDRPAVVLETKGSTGAPKLVPFTQRQLLRAAGGVVSHFGLRARDRGYMAMPLHGVDSQVVGILAVLLSGGSVVVADGFDRRSFWADVGRSQATWLNLVPAMVRSLDEMAIRDVTVRERLRFARVGGAALSLATHSTFWESTGISLVETYTLTEAAGPVAANPMDLGRRRAGSAGLPVGVEVRIVEGAGRAVPNGTAGRIQVRGAAVATHYVSYGRNRCELAAQEDDGWLATGDLGCFSREGYLYIAGREVDGELGRVQAQASGA
jgi:acyl-CoA synthetase (AMP-forming)/AMP-acid ligase II